MTRQEFEQIVPEIRQLMLGIGRNFFGNDTDAEDVAQDGLLQLWRYCERLDEGHNIPALAVRIAKHCCIDITRRRRLTPYPPPEGREEATIGPESITIYGASAPSPHDELEAAELRRAFDAAIDHLNPSERNLFQMRQLEGLTLDEISEQTHIAKPSAKSMISAARRKIFEAMKEHIDINPKYKKP